MESIGLFTSISPHSVDEEIAGLFVLKELKVILQGNLQSESSIRIFNPNLQSDFSIRIHDNYGDGQRLLCKNAQADVFDRIYHPC